MAINKVINRSTKTHAAMRNVIEYVLKEQKVKDGYVDITGPFPYEEINWDNVYQAFLQEKQIWDKDSGRMYAHNIISFHKDEDITLEMCLELVKKFVDKFFYGFQNLICVHQDKDHIHAHIVTNSVSYLDGRKLHQSKHDLQHQKEYTNSLCLEYGLSIAQKGKHFDGRDLEEGTVITWSKDKYHQILSSDKKSYLVDCAIAVMEVREASLSQEEFILGMKERGWNVNWTDSRKNITFENEEGKKVRDSTLSKTFTINVNKEALINEFERQNDIRLSKLRQDRADRREQEEQLNRYYSEVEAAIQGDGDIEATVGGIKASQGAEGQAPKGGENRGPEEDTDTFLRELITKERASEKEREDSYAERSSREAERARLIRERELEAERRAREYQQYLQDVAEQEQRAREEAARRASTFIDLDIGH